MGSEYVKRREGVVGGGTRVEAWRKEDQLR